MSTNIPGEIINIHFDQNQKRQGLTNISSSSSKPVNDNDEETKAIDDKSRKGSIDTRILNLVQQINNNVWPLSQETTTTATTSSSFPTSSSNPNLDDKNVVSSLPTSSTKLWNYFTTSSCSGRAILFTHQDVDCEESSNSQLMKNISLNSPENDEEPLSETISTTSSNSNAPQFRKTNQKKGCKWLYVTHDEVDREEFFNVWKNLPEGTYAIFKIESSIFHIQCRTLTSAKELIQIAATQAGFRNSGMVIGKDGKITVAVRSTIGLEVPLPVGKTESNSPIVSDQFLEYLITTGNQTLEENWKRTEKFANEFQKHFFPFQT